MANIVKAHVLGADEPPVDAAGRSTQLPEDSWDYDKTGAQEPPYSPERLSLLAIGQEEALRDSVSPMGGMEVHDF